jgi:hypothetical protein
MRILKLTAATVVSAGLMLLATGCNPPAKHPNQINSFDGSTYDSLTLAHAALTSLRSSISATDAREMVAFNQAAATYSVAFEAYLAFRSAPSNQTVAALALSDLTVEIIALENAFETDMHASRALVLDTRDKATRFRARAVSSKISISDILSELEIAASVAAAIPGTQPYATIAAVVIKATQQAVLALSSASGQPIDLATLTPVPSLP